MSLNFDSTFSSTREDIKEILIEHVSNVMNDPVVMT